VQAPARRRALIVLAASTTALLAGVLLTLLGSTPGPLSASSPPTGAPAQAGPGDQAGAVPPSVPASPTPVDPAALQAVLDARGAAAVAGDGPTFLKTVSSRSTVDLDQQRVLAGNLAEVGFSRWSYALGEPVAADDPIAERLQRRLGGQAEIRRVDLAYRIDGYDLRTVESERIVAFVRDEPGWRVGADIDTGAFRSIWDVAPVVASRSGDALVLSASTTIEGRGLSRVADAAVDSVSGIWGRDWDRKVVVVVPADQDQLGLLLRRDGDRYDQLAAVATSELSGDSLASAANRVWVNPGTWGRVTPKGKAIVMRHEITHVATGAAVPSDFPIWLEEGLADYIGYSGSGVPVSIVAQDLLDQARAGRIPEDLPDREAFAPEGGRLATAYEEAWWAMRLVEQQAGREGVLELYRAALEVEDQELADEIALRRVLGIGRDEFVRQWRASIREAA
jgi:hypothetical protein